MIYGLPIISSNLCIAGTELVKDGDNGYVVDLEDFGRLTACFKDLISDDSQLANFGKNSFLKIANYTFTRMVESHKSLLGGVKSI